MEVSLLEDSILFSITSLILLGDLDLFLDLLLDMGVNLPLLLTYLTGDMNLDPVLLRVDDLDLPRPDDLRLKDPDLELLQIEQDDDDFLRLLVPELDLRLEGDCPPDIRDLERDLILMPCRSILTASSWLTG